MKFLTYKGGRIELDYDVIHELTTADIIALRNKLIALRKLREIRSEVDIFLEFKNKDLQNIWMNYGLENTVIEGLNSMIIKRRLKEREDKKRVL